MSSSDEHKAELIIQNRMGFHVRPVQRFAEFSRMFKSDVEVVLRGRTVPGKSVMNLMSLGGRHGDQLEIRARGEDARQCVEVLSYLGQNRFFVEDEPDAQYSEHRHLCRLHRLAGAFESDIQLIHDGCRVDAKRKDQLKELDLRPGSRPRFEIKGNDAEQASSVLDNLVDHCFYVEDEMVRRSSETA